ncbi:hypothetical protein [Alloscardovia omnicolens]|uniref:hypothetical protein n=1 Tax=Alloscardovia omnicolens TaxID=419015 RepID=UPI00254B53E5|nr:hypothetical protein [Alloscardovia omnicolens]MDK6522707.1 hypothetical protein [Alloscardovia omnicolens]
MASIQSKNMGLSNKPHNPSHYFIPIMKKSTWTVISAVVCGVVAFVLSFTNAHHIISGLFGLAAGLGALASYLETRNGE